MEDYFTVVNYLLKQFEFGFLILEKSLSYIMDATALYFTVEVLLGLIDSFDGRSSICFFFKANEFLTLVET